MNKALIDWSQKNYSDLPWRRNRSVYNTLVSEIMLQQTTVSTVINHFDRFINKYPTVESLAQISEEQILIDWKGLGYYRRAKNLLKAAKEIKTKFAGAIPIDYEQLLSINGIGEYTASAILSMGKNKSSLAVDANLERVLARFYGLEFEKGPKLQKEIRSQFLAGKICTEIKEFGSRNFNEALMDLGRTICKSRSAACEICPLNRKCFAVKSNPLAYPIQKDEKQKEAFELHLLRMIIKRGDKIFVYKKNEKEWLSGQYEVPTFNLACEDASLKQYPKLNADHLLNLPSFKTSITKYKIQNYVLYCELDEVLKNIEGEFLALKDLNLSTGSLKALSHI